MAEENSKFDIFNSQIEAAKHSSERFGKDADALLARIFSCNHCFLDFLTIDAIQPIPKDVQEDEMEATSKAAVEGRLFMHWDMRPDESPDGAVYRAMCIMPYKCWEDFFGQIRLRQEMAQTPKIAEMVKRCMPCILRDDQLYFEGYDDGTPIDTFELDWRMFEDFSSDADDDYSRLEVVLDLLRENAKSEAITMMLDKNYCPERYKTFDQFGRKKSEMQKFMDEVIEGSAKQAAEELAAKQAEGTVDDAKAENLTSNGGDGDKIPDDGKAQA